MKLYYDLTMKERKKLYNEFISLSFNNYYINAITKLKIIFLCALIVNFFSIVFKFNLNLNRIVDSFVFISFIFIVLIKSYNYICYLRWIKLKYKIKY